MDIVGAMKLVVAIADEGSLAAAAEALGLSAPATTRTLAALEKRLGAQLIQRTTRRLRFTDAGQRYLEECRRVLQDIQEMERLVSGAQEAPSGELHLTAPVLFGQLFVMPILRGFLDEYQEVRARALLLDRPVHMLEEGLDLAVRLGPLSDPSLLGTRVGQVRLVVCAAPAYLKKRGVPRELTDLSKHRLVATSLRWRFRDREIPVQPQLWVTSNAAAVDAAVAGWGITRLPSYQVASLVESGALRILLADTEPEPWPIHVLQPFSARPPARVRLLAARLVEQLRGHPWLTA